MLKSFKRTREGSLIRTLTWDDPVEGTKTDISVIPIDEGNLDYQDYLRWKLEGNTASVADPPPPEYERLNFMSGSVVTLNATPTELFRATLAPGRGYVADYQIMAIQIGSPYNMLYGRWMQGAKRITTTAALVGTQQPVVPPQGDAAATGLVVAPSVTGGDFRIMVTGLAGVSIRWILRGTFILGSPDNMAN
jgi:hypothetical protein